MLLSLSMCEIDNLDHPVAGQGAHIHAAARRYAYGMRKTQPQEADARGLCL